MREEDEFVFTPEPVIDEEEEAEDLQSINPDDWDADYDWDEDIDPDE